MESKKYSKLISLVLLLFFVVTIHHYSRKAYHFISYENISPDFFPSVFLDKNEIDLLQPDEQKLSQCLPYTCPRCPDKTTDLENI